MKTADRAVLIGVALLGLVAAFWFMVLAPKRERASELSTEVAELQAQVEQMEAASVAGQQAQGDYASNYKRLIVLGKAVPADADTPSLLAQLQALSTRADVGFRAIALAAGAEVDPAPLTTTAPAPATEATAALLPIGATVGPAGLPVMPYTMSFDGGFFEIADFLGRVDAMVETSDDRVQVGGRLLTIDGFSLTAAPEGFPDLIAEVQATSFLAPADQGITAGADAGGPAPSTAVPATTEPAAEAAPEIAPAVMAN